MVEYGLSWILPYVRQSIPGLKDIFKFDEFADGVFALLEKQETPTIGKYPMHMGHTGRTYNESVMHRDIKLAVVEAFCYCEQNRFILRQPPTHGSYFNRAGFVVSGDECVITARGREWAKGVEPLPEDYNGYMKQFGATTDDVVRQYISEGLNTFIRGTYFASAVMVGAASEKAIYLLADSLLPTLKDAAKRATLQSRIKGRRFEPLFAFLEEIVVNGHKSKTIDYDVMGGTTRHLLSLFDHIKLQRNDAVHPMNFQVSSDSVRSSLNAFPLAWQKVEALRQWCNAHPNSL